MRVVARDPPAGLSRQVADEQRRPARGLPNDRGGGGFERAHQPRAAEVVVTQRAVAHKSFAAHGQLFGFREHALIGHADGPAKARSERRGRAEAATQRAAEKAKDQRRSQAGRPGIHARMPSATATKSERDASRSAKSSLVSRTVR